jgi:hypothetical protein
MLFGVAGGRVAVGHVVANAAVRGVEELGDTSFLVPGPYGILRVPMRILASTAVRPAEL